MTGRLGAALPAADLEPLEPADGTAPSVYVHAPFCLRHCLYCDFAVEVRKGGGSAEWLRALQGELTSLEREGRVRPAPSLETLYVGGGTPSQLEADAMSGLAGLLGEGRLGHSSLEWTVEANPESFSTALAHAWREAGVNRVSLGVQTFHGASLRWMGRLHGPRGAELAVAAARDTDFSSVSLDLIFALPAQLRRPWSEDLVRAVDVGVDHVSLYGLSVEPGTPLGRAVHQGREASPDDSRYREEFLMAAEILTASGFEHYEVSNFAKPGHVSRHNLVYWDGGTYLGLGNSSHSYVHPLRSWNLRDWSEYQSAVDRGELPTAGQEHLSPGAHRLEQIWLGLRTNRGIALDALTERARQRARTWTVGGVAFVEEGAVRLTAEGWLVLDRLAVELDGDLPDLDDRAARAKRGSRMVGPRASEGRGLA